MFIYRLSLLFVIIGSNQFELESTFIDISNTKKTNIIIGCIYKHPSMNINEFNDDYLNEILKK